MSDHLGRITPHGSTRVKWQEHIVNRAKHDRIAAECSLPFAEFAWSVCAMLALASIAAGQTPSTKTPLVGTDQVEVPSDTGTDGTKTECLERVRNTPLPKIDLPVSFDTPEADAILAALEVFPPNNPWNLLVNDWPLHPRSQQIVGAIGTEKPLRYNPDMGFILVPPDQKKVPVKLGEYARESDRGPYPIPEETPIEGWPELLTNDGEPPKMTLDDVQRDKSKRGGDRHGIVVDPTNRMLYEFYQLKKSDAGWSATAAAIFDLKSNRLRPDGWTSTDAAGLPVFPAVVRFDELTRGNIDHALRVTVPHSRKAYVYPATHYASRRSDPTLPRMGERLRLRGDFDISGFGPEAQTVLTALKRYGMFVADNGLAWALSVAPDPRIKNMHEELKRVKGADFEVVQPPVGYHPATDSD